MANIEQIIEDIANSNKIKTGKQMRAKLYEFANAIYEDASKKGNANMEVAQARGTFNTLNQRLNNSDSSKADKIELQNEVSLRQTADSDLQNQIEVEKARIDNITNLPEGSTTGDAELQDMRIGVDGSIYKTAGAAIRNQLEMSLKNFSDKTHTESFGSFTNKANAGFYITDKLFAPGLIKSIDLNIIDEDPSVNQDFIFWILDTEYKVIYRSETYHDTGVVNIPLNKFIEVPFYFGISCKNIGFRTIQNGRKTFYLSNANVGQYIVGTTMPIVWSSTNYNFDFRINYESRVSMLNEIYNNFSLNKGLFNFGRYNSRNSSIDFNDLRDGFCWAACTEDESTMYPFLNAPTKYGNYSVLTYRHTKIEDVSYYTQLAFLTQSIIKTKGVRIKAGLFIRCFNSDGETSIGWTYLGGSRCIYNSYIAIGDSITFGYAGMDENNHAIQTTYPYPTAIANILNLDLTYGAQNGAGWVFKSGGKSAADIIDETDFTNYNLVTLAFGVNDYLQNCELGNINDTTTDTVYGSIKHCLEKIYEDNKYITVVCITPINAINRGDLNTNFAYGKQNNKGVSLLDVCNAIKEVCNLYNVPFIDNSQNSIINKLNVNKGIYRDNLHPSDRLYTLLGSYYAGKISNWFKAYEI